MTEPLVRREEMARIAGISVRTLDRRVRAGCPSVKYGARIRCFNPRTTLRWLAERGLTDPDDRPDGGES